jgi:orotidine-5'-phosphate decarboxylase
MSASTAVSEPRIIVALDKPDVDGAQAFCAQLDPQLCRVKVGNELFTAGGPDVIRSLHDQGFQVFLDLKYHDIPNTVASACAAARALGVWMLNVHVSGGEAMLKAARDAIGPAGTGVPLLIGVTVLTSFAPDDLAAVGVPDTVDEQVLRLAGLAAQCGLDGLVCSAHEAQMLSRKQPALLTVTPGIRLATDAAADQRRIMTPQRAIESGASYLVIGRSISGAADPAAVLRAISADIPALPVAQG